MSAERPTLDALADFLHAAFDADAYPADERGGIYRRPISAQTAVAPAATRPLGRLGLALEPWPGLRAWAARERIDALFLHRPWRLAPGALAPDVGVLYSHLPFDEHLTTGVNAPLAERLGFLRREVFGYKDARPLGMLGEIAPIVASAAAALVADAFGGSEEVVLPHPDRMVSRVVVVGAMNDALVREAAARGVGLYVTGQLRPSARAAVAETGIAVSAIGHGRSERWGLAALATLVRARWAALVTVTGDSPERA